MNILKLISHAILVTISFLICVGNGHYANAAEFSIVSQSGPATEKFFGKPILTGQNAQTPCHIRLEGKIVRGDLNQLQITLDQLRALRGDKYPKHVGLCLHSPGGSYMEAIRIAKAMLGKAKYQLESGGLLDRKLLRTWTVVNKNDECFSACAVIFMAGNIYIDDESFGPSYSRHLHINGRLGFHSPYLPFKGSADTTYTADTIKLAFRQGALAVRELTKLGDNILHGGQMSDPNLMPRALINEMLATSEGDLYFIDQVGKVIAYRISLFGGKQPSKVGFCEYDNICGNHHYKELITRDNNSTKTPQRCSPYWTSARGNLLYSGGNRKGDIGGFGGEGLYYCVLRKIAKESGRIEYYSDLVESKKSKLNKYSFSEAEWWYYYPSNSYLKSLK